MLYSIQVQGEGENCHGKFTLIYPSGDIFVLEFQYGGGVFWKATPTHGPYVMLTLEKPHLTEDTMTCNFVAYDAQERTARSGLTIART